MPPHLLIRIGERIEKVQKKNCLLALSFKTKKSMEPNILSIIIGAIALIVGIVLGKFIFAKNTKKIRLGACYSNKEYIFGNDQSVIINTFD